MENYVDLSNLPTFKSGNKICINWKESVGKTIPFYYNEIKEKSINSI